MFGGNMMGVRKLVVLFWVVGVQGVKGQIMFEKLISSIGPNTANCIIQTNDSGYAVAGSYYTNFLPHFSLIKLNSFGNLQWNIIFGDYYYLKSVAQTPDRGYIACGTNENGPSFLLLHKLDSLGNIQWVRAFRNSFYTTVGNSVALTSTGGYVTCGYAQFFTSVQYGFIAKLDSVGNTLWSKQIDDDCGSTNTGFNSVIQTNDSGFIMCGYQSCDSTGNNLYVVKLDSSGNLKWSRKIIGPSNENGSQVIETSEGDYLVVGQTYSFGAGNYDVYVIKLDHSGNLLWSKTYGTSAKEGGTSICKMNNGDYLICGGIDVGSSEGLILDIDTDGNLQWAKYMAGVIHESLNSIIKTNDSGYACTGTTSLPQKMYIAKMDSEFNMECSPMIPDILVEGTGGFMDSGAVVNTLTIPYLTTSGIWPPEGNATDCLSLNTLIYSEESSFSIYPNPTTSTFTIEGELPEAEIKIYDVTGRLAYERGFGNLSPRSASATEALEVTVNAHLQPGIYFVRVEDGQRVATEKLVVE
jgi:hypothetical protein